MAFYVSNDRTHQKYNEVLLIYYINRLKIVFTNIYWLYFDILINSSTIKVK